MFTIVTSVKKEKVFKERLKRSLETQNIPYKLILVNSSLPLAESYNSIGKIETEYVMFVHQDVVFLEKDSLERIEGFLNSLNDLGVGGVVGFNKELCGHLRGSYYLTSIYKKNKVKISWLGKDYFVLKIGELKEAREVPYVDDHIIFLPKENWNIMQFSSEFPFHYHAHDYCIKARRILKKRNYVIPVKTWWLEDPWKEPDYFNKYENLEKAKKRLKKKWRI